MKKFITLILVLSLVLSLGSLSFLATQPVVMLTDGEGGTLTPDPVDPSPTNPPATEAPTTPTEAPTQAPTEAPTDPPTTPTEAPTEKPTEPSTPTTPPTDPTTPSSPSPTDPTQAPIYSGIPVVTKHPTDETVKEGGYAEFVARADNCTDIIWHLQNPGGSTDLLAEKAPIRYPGLVVTGLNSQRLGLDHIPKELDGWRVRAEFVGVDGNTWSNPAIINVMSLELSPPTIQQNPTSANLKPTEGTTLRVSALTSERNTTLTYQWYKNSINSNVGGKAILGATTDTFTPDYAAGTTYYYCAVRCTNGSDISVAAKTSCAAVTYLAVQETTAPTQTPTVTTPDAATLTPWSEPEATEETLPLDIPNAPPRSNTLLVIIVVVIVVIALLGLAAALLIMKFYPRGDEDELPPQPPRQPKQTRQPTTTRQQPSKFSAPRVPPREPKLPDVPEDTQSPADEWDDLSDLGDLSIYFDDEDELGSDK